MAKKVCMELVKAWAAAGHAPPETIYDYDWDNDSTLFCIGSRCAHWREVEVDFDADHETHFGVCGLSGDELNGLGSAFSDPAKEA